MFSPSTLSILGWVVKVYTLSRQKKVGHKPEASSTPLKISRTIFLGWPASIVSSLLPDPVCFEVILHPNSVHASIRVENEYHEFSVTEARDASRVIGALHLLRGTIKYTRCVFTQGRKFRISINPVSL